MATITVPIQVRQDTFANWTANNPTPRIGEWTYETDYKRVKIGDGVTAYDDLPYFTSGGGSNGAEYFPDEAALLDAYPTGTTGQFALVSGVINVTIWAWDPVSEEWVDTGNVVNFVIDDALDPLSDNAVKNKRIVEEFAKYLKTDGTIPISQVVDLTSQLIAKLEEGDIYNIVSPMLQQGFGISIQKTGTEFRFINTNPSGTAANWGSVGGDIEDQSDLQVALSNKLGLETGTNVPWAASVTLAGGTKPNNVFTTTDATGGYTITAITTSKTGYVQFEYIITLQGISSLVLTLPASVKEKGKAISGNTITIEGEIGDEITIWFEKRGSNWELFRENPNTGGASALGDLTDVDETGKSDNDVLTWDDTAGKWIPAAPTGGSGSTNLTSTPSPTTVIIASDTGTDATIVAVDGTNAGVMLPAQKTKLDGIATGATANDTDANLKNRANHTGTQAASTIVQDSSNRFSTDTEKATWNAKADTSYVDSATQGLKWKEEVRAATTANITLSGAQTIDGVSIVAGDRVLVKNQSTGSQNGIYVADAGAWSRSTDANTASEIKNATVPVSEGTVNADKDFVLVTDTITLETTSLVFTEKGGNVSDGSETAAGKFEEATAAEVQANTSVGGTGARLVLVVAKLWTWWTYVKTQANTWSGQQTFSTSPRHSHATAGKVMKLDSNKDVTSGDLELTEMADIAGLSVLANATNTTGKPTVVTATTAERVLVRNGANAIVWIQLTANYIAALAIGTGHLVANAVTFSKIQKINASRVIGNLSGSLADPTEVDVQDAATSIFSGVTATGNYTMTGLENIVNMNVSAAAVVTFTLAGSYIPYKVFWIKDIGGNAATNNITFAATGSDTIDDNLSISSDKGKRGYYSNGISKFFNVV